MPKVSKGVVLASYIKILYSSIFSDRFWLTPERFASLGNSIEFEQNILTFCRSPFCSWFSLELSESFAVYFWTDLGFFFTLLHTSPWFFLGVLFSSLAGLRLFWTYFSMCALGLSWRFYSSFLKFYRFYSNILAVE